MADPGTPPKPPEKSTSKPKFSPFTRRTQAMGSSGWETYTVGFTLVGCIVAGAGAGWWLDNRFGTSYWLPILFFVGVIGGFREMFLVISRSTKHAQRQQQQKEAGKTIYTPPSGDDNATDSAPARERIFQVPPPPLEAQPTPEEPTREVPETTEELIARLLEEPSPEEDSDDEAKDDKTAK